MTATNEEQGLRGLRGGARLVPVCRGDVSPESPQSLFRPWAYGSALPSIVPPTWTPAGWPGPTHPGARCASYSVRRA